MPHLIIIDKDGNPSGDPNEGHRETPLTIKELLQEDHAPSSITFQEPTLELTRILLKDAEKYFKK